MQWVIKDDVDPPTNPRGINIQGLPDQPEVIVSLSPQSTASDDHPLTTNSSRGWWTSKTADGQQVDS